MKTVYIYRNEFDARLASGKLESEGIKTLVVGAREYHSVVAGGLEGRYEVQVADEDYDAAVTILAVTKYAAASDRTPGYVESDVLAPSPSRALKRAVMFAVLGIVLLPVIFNYFSILHAARYARLETKAGRKTLWLSIIAALNLVMVYVVGMLVKNVFA